MSDSCLATLVIVDTCDVVCMYGFDFWELEFYHILNPPDTTTCRHNSGVPGSDSHQKNEFIYFRENEYWNSPLSVHFRTCVIPHISFSTSTQQMIVKPDASRSSFLSTWALVQFATKIWMDPYWQIKTSIFQQVKIGHKCRLSQLFAINLSLCLFLACMSILTADLLISRAAGLWMQWSIVCSLSVSLQKHVPVSSLLTINPFLMTAVILFRSAHL